MSDEVSDLYFVEKYHTFDPWLNSISDRQTKFRILDRLDRVKKNLGDFRRVGKDTFELRLDFGPGWRIYFTIIGQKVLLLIGGGSKDTQDKDIVKAIDIAHHLHIDA